MSFPAAECEAGAACATQANSAYRVRPAVKGRERQRPLTDGRGRRLEIARKQARLRLPKLDGCIGYSSLRGCERHAWPAANSATALRFRLILDAADQAAVMIDQREHTKPEWLQLRRALEPGS